MKKLFVALAFIVLLGWLLSSCKSAEKCPAYGQVEVEQSDTKTS